MHYPGDDAHPDGKMVLQRESSPMRDHLNSQLAENKRRHERIKQDNLDRIAVKRGRMKAKGVPAEKRAC